MAAARLQGRRGRKWDPSSSHLGIVGTWKQAFMARLCAGAGRELCKQEAAVGQWAVWWGGGEAF